VKSEKKPPYLDKTISTEKIGNIDLHLERHILTASKAYNYQVFHIPHFSVIIPKIGDNFVVIRQYRPSWRSIVLEFPAGVADKDEEPSLTALRELQEETGYKAAKISKLCSFRHSSRTTQFCHVFLAENLSLSSPNHDEGELIEEVLLLSPSQINEAITKGDFVDISHIAGWYHYFYSEKV